MGSRKQTSIESIGAKTEISMPPANYLGVTALSTEVYEVIVIDTSNNQLVIPYWGIGYHYADSNLELLKS